MTTISIVLGVTGIYALFDFRPRVSISKNGLWVRSISTQEIPWEEITSVELKWLPRSGDFITITLTNGQTHTFFAEGLQVSSKELLRMIREHVDQANQE